MCLPFTNLNTPKTALGPSLTLVLPELPFVTRLSKGGGGYYLYFCCKPPILMIFVVEDRYESPFSIDTKIVPVGLHLTLQ